MKRKAKKRNLKKDNEQRQRLVDLDIDEISLVDKPAIAEEFIITKRVEGKGKPTMKISKAKEIQKGVFWKRAMKKDAEGTKHGDSCAFCGITTEDEAKSVGMGLRSGVCFKCAVANMEHGVLDACIDGTFDLEKFKKDHPEVTLFTKADADDADDGKGKDGKKGKGKKKAKAKAADEAEGDSEADPDEDESEGDSEAEGDEAESDEDESEDGDEAEGDEDESDEDESDEDGDDEAEGDEAESDEDESEDGDEAEGDEDGEGESEDEPPAADPASKTTEQRLGEMEGMLASSMDFHEQTVKALHQTGMLALHTLELNLKSLTPEQAKLVKELKEKIKTFRGTVQKAGAKISASRLQTLRDVVDRLATLIQSVAGEAGKDGKTGGKKTKKSVSSDGDSAVLAQLQEMQKSFETALAGKDAAITKLTNRLDDLDAFGGASTEIEDDDDSDDSDDSDSEDEGGSVFKDFGPLTEVSKRINKHTRITTKKK